MTETDTMAPAPSGAASKSDSSAAKKITVRTLATEINVSHETLIEFLQKKGFTAVKTIMSKVEPDALDIVMKQFGKEKDVTDKRHKKLAAFKEKRAKTQEEYRADHHETRAPEAHPVEVPVPTPPTITPAPAPAISEPAPVEPDLIGAAVTPTEIEVPSIPPKISAPTPEITEATGSETLPELAEAAPTEPPPAIPPEGEHEVRHGLKRKFRRKNVIATGEPMDLRVALPGLKIKGKIELAPPERQGDGRGRGAGKLKTRIQG
ncbi:MAG: translation initiation factor IF-2 N-terminal domain-containing protein, partial [Candidatus Kapaibacterium sp.]